MLTSVQWLNRFLDPADLTAEEAVRVLEASCFPIEGIEEVGGDTQLDVELTSNRGDCFAHATLARDIAAITGRAFLAPIALSDEIPASDAAPELVRNEVPELCPRFTARRITGVRVGPSPQWLQDLLIAVGLRPINNVADATNFMLYELGYPSHAFDANTLNGGGLVVRHARAGESLTALDGRTHTLVETDLVVADHEKAVSLAGVIGGLETGVTEQTTDVLLEVATWDVPTIRATARRLDIRTDAGYRFERIVNPQRVAAVNDALAHFIAEIAGGTVEPALSIAGPELAPARELVLRTRRCADVLGITVQTDEIVRLMRAIGVGVEVRSEGEFPELGCTIPFDRPDLLREIDLIEEVVRLHGIDQLPVSPRVEVPLDVEHPELWERRERATDVIATALCGLGFYETVTFSFLTEKDATLYLPAGLRLVKIDEDRRKEAPFLRPSIVPSLLHCRRGNQDGRVSVAGGVRLFEFGAVFAEEDDGDAAGRKTKERRTVAFVLDAGTKHEPQQQAVRTARAAIDAIVEVLAGPGARAAVRPCDPFLKGLEGGTCARVDVDGSGLGFLAVIGKKSAGAFGLDEPCVVCELDLAGLIDLYPPQGSASLLPKFPAIERDLSVIVSEELPWSTIAERLDALALDRCVGHAFVGTYRGKQVGAGKKSVTFRLRFRDDERTLRHEEVDPQMEAVVAELKSALQAEVRS